MDARQTLADLTARVDAQSLRERALILLILLALLYAGWDAALMQPLGVGQDAIRGKLERVREEVSSLDGLARTIVARRDEDPDAANRIALRRSREELLLIKADLQASTRHLIPPHDMAKVLETVIEKSKGLKFVRLEGLGATSVVSGLEGPESAEKPRPAEPGARAGATPYAAYKHGVRIEFEGDYLSTLDFLRQLESLPWAFFWDRVDFQAAEFPKASGSVTVYTLSLDQNWIGI